MNEELNKLIEKYRENDNYLISSDEKCKQTVIYFSSLGIYENDNIESFKKNIIKKNKFEFYGTRIKNSKHIFIRDIAKDLYRKGINSKINSQKKLLDFLKEQVQNSEVITVGSSAGGYAALLFGNLLNAKKIFSFSPVVEVDNNEYILMDILENSKIPSYILYPSGVSFDVATFNKIKDFPCIKGVSIKSIFHGVPIQRKIVEKIINSNDKKLEKIYSGNSYNERIFVIKHFGLYAFLERMITKNLEIMASKSKEKHEKEAR